MKLRNSRPVTASLLAVLLSIAGLTACSSGSATSSVRSVSAAGSSSTTPRGNRSGLFSDPKVRQCLSAAGISLPSRVPGVRPSGSARPDFTGAPPTGVRPGGGGGLFNPAANSKVQQALKACGITLPARGDGASPRPMLSPPAA